MNSIKRTLLATSLIFGAAIALTLRVGAQDIYSETAVTWNQALAHINLSVRTEYMGPQLTPTVMAAIIVPGPSFLGISMSGSKRNTLGYTAPTRPTGVTCVRDMEIYWINSTNTAAVLTLWKPKVDNVILRGAGLWTNNGALNLTSGEPMVSNMVRQLNLTSIIQRGTLLCRR